VISLVESKREPIAEACRRRRVRQLEVFGSSSGPTFDAARSDVDFLVRFEPMAPADHADAYFGLLADLERLLDRRVDLVESVAASNPCFMANIQATRDVLYPHRA